MARDAPGRLTRRRVTRRSSELQLSYERARAVMAAALDGLIVMDHEGRVRELNPTAEQIFGHRRADVVGRLSIDAIIPLALGEAHRLETAPPAGGGDGPLAGRRTEVEGVRADGSKVPLELSISRLPSRGQPWCALFVRDLTQRRREEALHAEYAAIVESSDDAIVGKDLQGIINSWNPGAERLFGYSAQEAIGQPMLIVFPPERVEEEAEILARLARGERVDHFETVRVRKDGSRIDVSVTISPIRNRRGDIIGASKIARDISDRKRSERKLAAQLARLDLLGQITRAIGQRQDLASIFQVAVGSVEDNLPVDFACICQYDQTANFLRVASVGTRSAALANVIAIPRRQRISIDQNGLSRCVRGQLVYEPELAQVHFPFAERLLGGGLHALVCAPLQVESRVFGVLIAARHEPHSFNSGECEFLRQLSEHVALAGHQAETHAALQRAYDDLRQTQQAVMQQERLRALGQLASGIAHDINNALSPVALYTASLLEREPGLSAQGRGQLETIQRAVDDIAQTVARMREFYRPRGGQVVLLAVQLNLMVQQVVDLTRPRWRNEPQQRGVVIEMRNELATDLPVLMGVESEIREALTNLILNAVDAMPDGGVLGLATGVSADELGVWVEVSDTGIGMDEDTRRRCLEPFFTTKGERGTGMGLATVYGVVQRHGGEIEIDSRPGKGTRMRLIFPRWSAKAADAAPAAPSAPALPPRMHILVIDDDPMLLKSLRDTLEADGHVITTASGGQQGIAAFAAAQQGGQSFAAVITDLGMPQVDGRRVAASIKGLSPSTPVILLTGWGQRLVAQEEMPEHVDHLLDKPPKLRQLREALAKCAAGK